MPQDIPLEASDVLAFIPESLKCLGDKAPEFTIAPATTREKRQVRRLYARNGLERHSEQSIREEILKGLEALWDEASFKQNAAMLKAYWDACDDFELASKEDPELVFEYDEQLASACKQIPRRVAKFWPDLGDMLADNADFTEMTDPIHVSVVVRGWTNLDTPVIFKDGYLDIECVGPMSEALLDLEVKRQKTHNLEPGAAWVELVLAAYGRFSLPKDEEKNSASPSPARTTRSASKTRTGRKNGKSPASASSKKTPESE